MALTDAQKAQLAELKVKINEWKSEQLALIDEEFVFLNSIQIGNSSLSSLTSSTLVDDIASTIAGLQLTGEAYDGD